MRNVRLRAMANVLLGCIILPATSATLQSAQATSTRATSSIESVLPSSAPSSNITSGASEPSATYNEPLRPQIHYSPPHGFMNDPNGLFRDDNGTWHLYYQSLSKLTLDNPAAVVAGNQHWGHATSPDLYHWTNEPPVLAPPAPGVGVFSGSAVIDTNNTSGLFNDTAGIVAVYTLDYAAGTWPNAVGSEGNTSAPREVQCIAYSTDGGYTFTPYEKNPVLDIGSPAFRDPKVIRVDDAWVMAIALADERLVQFYTSSNLIQWSLSSNFSTELGAVQWECPNLVRVDDAWLLLLSTNPGGMWGGSTTVYWTGTWNGTHFLPKSATDEVQNGAAGEGGGQSPGHVALATASASSGAEVPQPKPAEWGPDAYAGQVFFPDTTEAVYIPWANNWAYVQKTPTAKEGWRGAMGLPRTLHFDGDTLLQAPYVLGPIQRQAAVGAKSINGSMAWTYDTGLYSISVSPSPPANSVQKSVSVHTSNVRNGAEATTAFPLLLQINITGLSGDLSHASINWTFFNADANAWLESGYVPSTGQLWISRARVGKPTMDNSSIWPPEANYTSRINTTYFAGGALGITVLFDASLLETFVDGGRSVATLAVYPSAPLTQVGVWTALPPSAQVTATVARLQRAWSTRDPSTNVGKSSNSGDVNNSSGTADHRTPSLGR